MPQIFISYSRKDIDFVRKLAEDLEKAGYDVWWDISDLRGGDDWVSTIAASIASSRYVIVVLTPDAVESEWVRREYTQALSLRKKVIPILLKPVSLPFALNTINFVNFTSGEYADRFKELLSALDFTGKPPEVTPYRRALLLLSPRFLRLGIPLGIGIAFLLVLLARAIILPVPDPSPTPTFTPTLTATPTPSETPSPTASPTSSPTSTSTPTSTETPTRTPSFTPTPSVFSLPICIYGDSRVNVRAGPSSDRYIPVGVLEGNGTKCPFFSAYVRNRDQEIWFQLAPSQNAELEEFAGKWIYETSLAAVDRRVLPLPICIYDPNATIVDVHVLPGRNEALLENTLRVDGTDCPFFDTRTENNEGIWYRFAPNQKEKKDDFGQYAGGWIHEAALVVNTLNLPMITLTPTSTPSNTPTPTPTFTPTLTATPTPSETPSPTTTESPTATSTN